VPNRRLLLGLACAVLITAVLGVWAASLADARRNRLLAHALLELHRYPPDKAGTPVPIPPSVMALKPYRFTDNDNGLRVDCRLRRFFQWYYSETWSLERSQRDTSRWTLYRRRNIFGYHYREVCVIRDTH